MCKRLICVIMLLCMATSAWAAQIAYDGFEGLPNTDLDGSSGGYGWAAGSAWSHTLGTSNTFTLTEPGMTFPMLETTGLKAVFVANGDYYCDYERLLASPITVDASNPEVWVSALIEIGTGAGDNNAGRGIGVEMKNGETNVVAFGKGINKNYGVGVSMTGGATFINISTSRSVGIVFMALKLSWTGTDTNATVYYATGREENFDLNNLETFSDTASTTLAGPITFDRINLYGSHGGTTSNAVDEIRVGQSHKDVIAGPRAGQARNPSPANESADVPRDVVLSWMPGESAATHDVYFGMILDDVSNASRTDPRGVLASQGQADAAYDPADRLGFGQTYYWRIDEVNAPPTSTIFKGDVWSFTTEPFAYPIGVAGIIATASSSNKAEEMPEKTVNGSGLDADDLHSAEATDMWLSSLTGAQPSWIQYEFDRVYNLHQMVVWNYNSSVEPAIGFGVKEAKLEYSTDGTNWTTLGTTYEFARGPGAAGYAANTTVDLSGVAAKYIKITANSNWGSLVNQYGLSEVRFSYIPVTAREPDPASGATDVAIDAMLSWRAGREAAKHNVYLSSDEQAVIDGTAPVVTVTAPTYSTSLDLASTYYWRVDEVNEVETPASWQGDLWSLSTQEYLVVDDFEAYNDIEAGQEGSNFVYDTWADGFANPATNGSTMGYTEAFQPSMEKSRFFDGKQSAPLSYNNTAASISEVTANVVDLLAGKDWSKYGIKGLTLRFYGDPNNAPQQMYAKVNGAKVLYDGDAQNLKDATWQMWYIDLASLGTNLSNVNTLTIGLERIGGLGGQGMILLDGIRLYSYERQLITPAAPGTANLAGHWQFDESSGATATDSSNNGHHGTLEGNPQRVAGYLGGALQFGGSPDRVVVPYNAQLNPDNAFTVGLWANVGAGSSGFRSPITSRDDSPQRGYIIYAGSNGNWQFWIGTGSAWAQAGGPPVQAGEWTHVTGVYENGGLRLYINGVQAGQGSGRISLNTQQYLSLPPVRPIPRRVTSFSLA